MPSMDSDKRSVDEISASILAKGETILDVVASFGPELTSKEAAEREGAVEFLAKIVTRFPPRFLAPLEVQSLLDFFSARLQDTVLVGTQVYSAIHHLTTKSENLPEGSAFGVIEALLKEQNVQSCSHESRHLIFSTLGYLIQHRGDELRKAGSEFTLMFMRSIDGERDPRCLLQVFGVFATVASQMFLGPFSQDLFEVIACYFPVDFSPPEDDPYGITADQLASALELCLVAHPSFAEPCFELIEETLTSEDVDEDSKEAGLSLLEAALEVFSPGVCVTYASPIWQNLRRNILIPKGAETESKALLALQALAKCLSKKEIEDRTRRELVRQVLNDCEPFLMNVEMKLLVPTSALLRTIALVQPSYAQQIVPRVTPILVEKAQQGDTNRQAETEYVPILSEWIEVAHKMDSVDCISYLLDPIASLLLHIFRSNLQPIVLSAAFSTASVLVSVETSEKTTGGVSEQNFCKLAEATIDGFLVFGDDGVRKKTMECLRSFAVRKSEYLPVAKLAHLLKSKAELNPEAAILYGCLLTDDDNGELVSPHLFSFVEHGPLQLALESVNTLIQFSENEQEETAKRHNYCLEILSRIRQRMSENGMPKEEWERNLKKSAVTCLNLMLASPKNEENIIEWVLKALTSSLKDLVQVYQKDVCLFESILSAVQPKDSEKIWSQLNKTGYMNCIKTVDSTETSEFTVAARLAAFRTLCSLVAKFPKSLRSEMGASAVADLDGAIALPENHGNSEGAGNGAGNNFSVGVHQLGHLAGSLLICNWQPQAIDTLTKLLNCASCSEDALPEAVQEMFDAFDEADKQRIPKTFLFRQRVLSQIVPVFLKTFRSHPDGKKALFSVLGVILANIHWQTGAPNMEIAKLVPILIEALGESGSSESCGPVVGAVKQMLGSDISARPLQIHLETLINRLISFATSNAPMEQRLEALECLALLPRRYATTVVQPYRKVAKRKLLPLLDSHKRIMRRAAVVANNSW